jgi:FlaA1/EpsC-like NDP-sugar epimerase/lipopolysaccharide/colanic/teichoic acid biosynthesis glycosyltransferase
MKRLLDISLSFVGLLVLWPLFLVVAILIKLDSRGPVFFRQERVGRNFKTFLIWKFRTMVANAPELGPELTAGADRRITRIGALLRQTKIDELPQLINVLVGEMSMVGSRPEVWKYVTHYRDEYREVLTVRPGITDPASIIYRNETAILGESDDPENTYIHVILPDKIRLARNYVRDSSLAYDIKLIVATVVYLLYPARALDVLFGFLMRHHFVVNVTVQLMLLAAANVVAFALRFDGVVPAREVAIGLAMLPVLLVLRLLSAAAFGLFRGIWRYVGTRDLIGIAQAMTLSSVAFWAVLRAWPMGHEYPRAVLVLDWALCVCLLGGIRMARRLHDELRNETLVARRVMVLGSGDSTERVVRQMLNNRDRDYRLIGLVDGDPQHKGLRIHGIPVLGDHSSLARIMREQDPDELVIAMPASQSASRADAIGLCREQGRPFRVVRDIKDILAGHDFTSFLRNFGAEALLFREPIHTDKEKVRPSFAGKRVLITGAGGSIGSEICRQVAALGPEKLILFEQHEASLYDIERDLRASGYGDILEPLIGDVADEARVSKLLARTRPHIVFHAAAYKHVPMMEHNPSEAFRTNVIGTRTVARAAGKNGVDVMVLISTDKAVEPCSVMGTTKRIAELVLKGMQPDSPTRLAIVRFGNVLESSGSVIPLFREQIEKGGPITVTHPDVTRLFMTVPEAVGLIQQAATLGRGGDVFVLDMGAPIRILDMAKALVRLYGLRPGRDIPIVFTGMRPGERLHEKLFNDYEETGTTQHPKILTAIDRRPLSSVRAELALLMQRLGHVSDENGDGLPTGTLDQVLASANRERPGIIANPMERDFVTRTVI